MALHKSVCPSAATNNITSCVIFQLMQVLFLSRLIVVSWSDASLAVAVNKSGFHKEDVKLLPAMFFYLFRILINYKVLACINDLRQN